MPSTRLPINIDELIKGRTVEGERLEFKKGWNPEAVIHTRPYKAPLSLSKEAKEFSYYIRKVSATVRATRNDEVELLGLTATVPFDDRIAHLASLDDLNLALIRDFLREVGSLRQKDSSTIPTKPWRRPSSMPSTTAVTRSASPLKFASSLMASPSPAIPVRTAP